ncbi:hypothetical protein EGW08_003653, partial [Elysia chlorotica]
PNASTTDSSREATENDNYKVGKEGEAEPKPDAVSVTEPEPSLKIFDSNDNGESDIKTCEIDDRAWTASDMDKDANINRHNPEAMDDGKSSPDVQKDGEKMKGNAEEGDKQNRESRDKQEEGSNATMNTPSQSVADESNVEIRQQVGDNCPVCLATAPEATFLTSVHGQGEGLVIDLGSQLPQEHQHQQQRSQQQQQPQDTVPQRAADRDDGGFTDENLVPPVGNYDDVRLKDTQQPGARFGRRATSAVPGRTRFGLQNQQHPVPGQNVQRPQSAVDHARYFVINNSPPVMAMGQAAGLHSHSGGGGHFKTDFQQEREDAWRRTTRHGRQRPLTAIVQRSSSQFPIAQQHIQTSQSTRLRDLGLKITRTDGWLAGGRDLYWEGVRKRPKSGHTPGWLEGLPDSMKKQRPKSAFCTSLHQQPRSRLSQRPQSGSALVVSSCYRLDRRVTSQPASSRPSRSSNVRYMLTFNHPQQQQLRPKPQLQLSPQQHQQQEEQLLLLGPDLGVEDENPPPLTSPVSDAGRQDWSYLAMEY